MTRKAFYSFHFAGDSWRAAQVRNMGFVESNSPASDHDWEAVKKGGEAAIKKWIDGQMFGRSVVIVLIGANTAGRPWINYEIRKGWDEGKGLLGLHIHNLMDKDGKQSPKGRNPFDEFTMENGTRLSQIVKVSNSMATNSKVVYEQIKCSIADLIEEAIEIRNRYS